MSYSGRLCRLNAPKTYRAFMSNDVTKIMLQSQQICHVDLLLQSDWT